MCRHCLRLTGNANQAAFHRTGQRWPVPGSTAHNCTVQIAAAVAGAEMRRRISAARGVSGLPRPGRWPRQHQGGSAAGPAFSRRGAGPCRVQALTPGSRPAAQARSAGRGICGEGVRAWRNRSGRVPPRGIRPPGPVPVAADPPGCRDRNGPAGCSGPRSRSARRVRGPVRRADHGAALPDCGQPVRGCGLCRSRQRRHPARTGAAQAPRGAWAGPASGALYLCSSSSPIASSAVSWP